MLVPPNNDISMLIRLSISMSLWISYHARAACVGIVALSEEKRKEQKEAGEKQRKGKIKTGL